MDLDLTAPDPVAHAEGSVETASDAVVVASILSSWKRSLRVLPAISLRRGGTGIGVFAGEIDRVVAVLARLAGRLDTVLGVAVERLAEELVLDRLLSARLRAGPATRLIPW